VVPDLASHPFERLRAAGVAVTVSSDDPPLFGTTLSEEYGRLADTFGYDAETCAALALAALRASFLPPAEKEVREQELLRELSALGEELLGRPVAPATSDERAPAGSGRSRP
jgi:adenosine deaminase